MERRKALALAATVTCVLGSTTVAFASVGGVSLLGFGGSETSGFSASAAGGSGSSGASIEAETRNVYDRVVVEGTTGTVPRGSGTPTSSAAPGVTATPLPAPPTAVENPTNTTHRRHHAPTPPAGEQPSRVKTPSDASTTTTTEPETETTSPPDAPPSTTTTPTTLPPVTTTTRPPGVPKDWPPGKPIPPMPPNCRHGELEDNGVWNCGDD